MDKLSDDNNRSEGSVDIYEICQHMDLETLKNFTASTHRMMEICKVALQKRRDEEKLVAQRQFLKKIILYQANRSSSYIDVSNINEAGYGIRVINNVSSPSS